MPITLGGGLIYKWINNDLFSGRRCRVFWARGVDTVGSKNTTLFRWKRALGSAWEAASGEVPPTHTDTGRTSLNDWTPGALVSEDVCNQRNTHTRLMIKERTRVGCWAGPSSVDVHVATCATGIQTHRYGWDGFTFLDLGNDQNWLSYFNK